MTESRSIRIGLVGLKFGRYLARTLTGLAGVELAAVADRGVGADDLAAIALPPGVRVFREAHEMLDACALDALVLAVSPLRRASLLSLCAKRGLPVFVEKPWAGNPRQAREFAEICAPIADRTMVGFSFRFHAVVRTLRDLIEGDLGAPWMANGEYAFHWNLGPGGWLWDADGGGGVLNENSCHLFDTVCHLLGRPVGVQARIHNPRLLPGPELAAVVLDFPSGAIAALTLGALGAASMQDYPRLDLVLAHGRASLRGHGHVWESLSWAGRDEQASHMLREPPEVLGHTRYSAALAHFTACIRTGATPAATIEDGIFAVDLAAAVQRSAATGCRVLVGQPHTNAR